MIRIFAVAAVGLLVMASTASATIVPSPLAIDFRDNPWFGAHGQTSWTVGNVTATALPNGSELYHDSVQSNIDGLGILGGENDEVDLEECLLITISGGRSLNGVWITDLFDAPDAGVGENGTLSLNNGAFTFNFDGNNSHQGNGELYVDFGASITVFDAKFWADNTISHINANDNEFSVAGFTEAAVPEPATLLLIGTGLLGARMMRRRKRS